MKVMPFVHEMGWQDVPAHVQHQARRCLLDTLGVAIGARETKASGIIYGFAAAIFQGDQVSLWLDGRKVSAPGAGLAHGMTIDSLDMHDGYTLTKGHAGAAVVPAVLAAAAMAPAGMDGQALLSALVVGYEVALRAGVALHQTACDYHTSGAWNALGCAAVFSRLMELTEAQTRHALGIAEYHGPRSQMMRVIDYPTMLKDGSGWGAMAGISAALLAAEGFTGAPAITVEGEEMTRLWADLGARWRMVEQYFKPYAVCRWAQPAITAARRLQEEHQLAHEEISQVEVTTFHEAACLTVRQPRATDEAQYSLPFSLAAALVHQQLGSKQLSGEALQDPRVLRLSRRVKLTEDESFNRQFPARRLARVRLQTRDGEMLESGVTETEWEADSPPDDEALVTKFRQLVSPLLGEERSEELAKTVWSLQSESDVRRLIELLA